MPTTTLTRIDAMSDEQLDLTLAALYVQHRDADGPGRRKVLHNLISRILAEQGARLDVWLGEHGSPSLR